jgi:hypothetical protein
MTMAKKPKHHGHDDDRDRDHDRDHEHERRSDRDDEDSGDDPRTHAKILERRWLESPPPTLERYARALRQWQALPGAVSRPATDVTVAAQTPARASQAPAGPRGAKSGR